MSTATSDIYCLDTSTATDCFAKFVFYSPSGTSVDKSALNFITPVKTTKKKRSKWIQKQIKRRGWQK